MSLLVTCVSSCDNALFTSYVYLLFGLLVPLMFEDFSSLCSLDINFLLCEWLPKICSHSQAVYFYH